MTFSSLTCAPVFFCSLKLSLSSFYATECKTKEYVQILATPGRDRAAAKDPAEIQKKKKREKPSRMKHKKTPPFPLLGHKFHFFSVTSFALQLLLTAFNLLPFLSCRSSFFLKQCEVFTSQKMGTGQRVRRVQQGDLKGMLCIFFFSLSCYLSL